MILTKPKILKLIKKQKIIVEPFDSESIGPASIDLSLDSTIRIFNNKKETINLKKDIDYKSHTKPIDITKGFTLKPKQLIMGITKEKITLPNNISAWIHSRSKFARMGLMSHISAPFIAPGVSNKQVLEIYNASNKSLKLMPGLKICHIILEQCKGKAKYSGIFQNQELK